LLPTLDKEDCGRIEQSEIAQFLHNLPVSSLVKWDIHILIWMDSWSIGCCGLRLLLCAGAVPGGAVGCWGAESALFHKKPTVGIFYHGFRFMDHDINTMMQHFQQIKGKLYLFYCCFCLFCLICLLFSFQSTESSINPVVVAQVRG
jgi:hypothetical protein